MLHPLAGVSILVANLVNYNCHPQEDDNKNGVKIITPLSITHPKTTYGLFLGGTFFESEFHL